jgi:glycosyltransferase involved in cell wall biosynthesis
MLVSIQIVAGSMAKILVSSASYILSDYLLTSEGTHCYNLFKHLAKYGYEFIALSPYIRIQEELDNVEFHQVGTFKLSPTSPSLYKYVFHTEFQTRGFMAARKILRTEKIDIVHHMLPAVFNYTFSPLAIMRGYFKQPFVFGPLSSHYFERPLNEKVLVPLTSRLHKKTIQKCDRIITISNQVKDLYSELIGQAKISVIPFGIDAEVFRPGQQNRKQDQLSLLYAGWLYPLKGVACLVEAVAEAKKLGLKIKLKIAGEGAQKQELVSLARKLGIEKDVDFLGVVPYSEMPKQYQNCDIFCFPTLGEPLGKGLIEAMACSKPVIASKIGGPTEIIQNGINGVLVPPGDAQALAEKILLLENDENARRRMGERARETILERFSSQVVAKKYHLLYSEFL